MLAENPDFDADYTNAGEEEDILDELKNELDEVLDIQIDEDNAESLDNVLDDLVMTDELEDLDDFFE